MKTEWKQRLYDNYISTGQSGININPKMVLRIENYPHYLRFIKKFLPKEKDISILDLACGHGALIFCLKELGYNNIRGIDISPEQVDLAHKFGLNEIQCLDMMNFLLHQEDTYDAIFLMDILEHLNKNELIAFLESINKSLKKNGIVVIHVPNGEGIFGMRIRYGDITHENCFTSMSISQVLRASGTFSIKCFEDTPVVHGFKSMFRYIIWVLLSAPFRLLMAAETGTTKHFLSQNIFVIAKKVVYN